jgi:hypothetical protein
LATAFVTDFAALRSAGAIFAAFLRVEALVAFAAFTSFAFVVAVFETLFFALRFGGGGAGRVVFAAGFGVGFRAGFGAGFGAGFFTAAAAREGVLFFLEVPAFPERAPRLEATLAFFDALLLPLCFAGALLLPRAADFEPLELLLVAIVLLPPESATALPAFGHCKKRARPSSEQ